MEEVNKLVETRVYIVLINIVNLILAPGRI